MSSKVLFRRHISKTSANFSIITLIPCDNESYSGDDFSNLSHDSIDSSELVDSSDDEVKAVQIKDISKINKQILKITDFKIFENK